MDTSLLAEPAAAASVSAASTAAAAGGGEEQKEGVPQLVVVYEQAPSGNEDGEGGVLSPLQQQRDSFSSSLPPPQPLTLANMPQSAASERRDSIPSMRLTAAQIDGYRKAGSALWNRKTVAAALLFVFLLIVVASAATIGPKVLASSSTSTSGGGSPVVLIVSPYGDDEGGDGSSQRPFATITRAALGADGATPLPPGSSVLVGAGQYTLTAGIVTAVNGTASQRISFASIEPWGATLTWAPPLGARLSAGMWLNSGSFVDISGFQLQLGGSGAGSGGGSGPALVSGIVNSGRQVRVVGNYLHSAGTGTGTGGGGTGGGGGAAISSLYPGATAGSGNIVSQNLVAFATSPSPSPLTAPAAAPASAPIPATTPGQGAGPELHGILVAGGSDVVANNIVLGAPGDGVRLDCTAAAAAATAAPSSVAPCVASVGYNLVANCSGSGVSVLGLAGGTSAVSANALVFNAGSALATDTAAARFVARFNLVFRNGAGVCAAILQQQQAALCSSQTVADPGFAVPLSAAPAHYFGTAALAADVLRDFTPRCHGPKSPLVNGAEALPAVSLVDFLGQPRPRFGPVDAGPIQAHCRSSPRSEAE